jgi:hypothetical protein
MFADSPELQKMMEMIEVSDYAGLEDYTYHLLNMVADENLFMEVWITDSRRGAIRFALSVLYADPSSVSDVNQIPQWITDSSEFIEFLLVAETNYGIEGWANIFNSVAQKHFIDNVLVLPAAQPVPKDMSLADFLDNDNMYAVIDIPDVEQAWTEMIGSGKMFAEDFTNDWE